MRRILVTGAGGPAAANFIHSLRLSGKAYYIVGTDSNKWHLELANVDALYRLPRFHEGTYLPRLIEVIKREKIDVVHAQPDVEVLKISQYRDKLGARTFLPTHKTIALCQNKYAATAMMAASGLPTPGSIAADNSPKSLWEATEIILKNHKKAWVRAIRGAGAKASLPVTNADQAVAWARYWVEEQGLSYSDFMVSQFLPGREYAFQSLWRDGELITSAVRERLEYLFGHLSPSGQSSSPSVARSVHNPAVNVYAIQAIEAIDAKPNGIFCVDLKEDEAGWPLVTEINAGRFFTTSNFFAVAGSNMPDIYMSLAYGDEIDPDLPPYDAVPADLYWVRQMDMGYRLVPEHEWRAIGAS
jgi:biotin carboxylase